MEPDACMAKIEEDGRLLVCSSTQNVFHDLRMVCDITGLTEDQVHIVAATVGGGFGGKDGSTAQLFTALAAFKTRRPCKLIFSRQESLATTYKRHAVYMHVKMGFKKDGTMVAFDAAVIWIQVLTAAGAGCVKPFFQSILQDRTMFRM